jgi:hypothetical protein
MPSRATRSTQRAAIGRPQRSAIVLAAGALVIVGACGSGAGPGTSIAASSAGDTSRPNVADLPQGSEPVELDPADFTTEIDNPYLPMVPGTRLTYREVGPDGEVMEVVVIVTNTTKQIANGVTALVVRDTVTMDGKIIEDTFDWYAQDQAGNVWYFGEDTAEFEDGEITTTAGSFEAGVDGALPGIIMPANPTPGMKYRQEYYAGEAEDNGEVLSTLEMADVPFGHFEEMLLTKDTITLEPEVLQYKLYARGVGVVLVLDVSGGRGREELVDVDIAPEGAGTGPLGNPSP